MSDKIREEIETAYNNEGPSSAYDVALKHGVSCRYCRHCDAETPDVSDGCCSLCGQPYEEKE